MQRIRELYEAAFPPEEKKPFSLILEKEEQKQSDIIYIEEDGHFAGMAITLIYDDLVLLDYFAIAEESRGRSIGTSALQMLFDYYKGYRFILEIENVEEEDAKNLPERIRRKHFYESNGMEGTGILVVLFGVQMELMTYQTPITYSEYFKLYDSLYGTWIRDKVSPLRV